jgi:hypothetical protein
LEARACELDPFENFNDSARFEVQKFLSSLQTSKEVKAFVIDESLVGGDGKLRLHCLRASDQIQTPYVTAQSKQLSWAQDVR